MVQFEARMERERWEPWASEYLDYALLKRRIKDASAYKDDARKELVMALTNVFQGLFDNEVEKVGDRAGVSAFATQSQPGGCYAARPFLTLRASSTGRWVTVVNPNSQLL